MWNSSCALNFTHLQDLPSGCLFIRRVEIQQLNDWQLSSSHAGIIFTPASHSPTKTQVLHRHASFADQLSGFFFSLICTAFSLHSTHQLHNKDSHLSQHPFLKTVLQFSLLQPAYLPQFHTESSAMHAHIVERRCTCLEVNHIQIADDSSSDKTTSTDALHYLYSVQQSWYYIQRLYFKFAANK